MSKNKSQIGSTPAVKNQPPPILPGGAPFFTRPPIARSRVEWPPMPTTLPNASVIEQMRTLRRDLHTKVQKGRRGDVLDHLDHVTKWIKRCDDLLDEARNRKVITVPLRPPIARASAQRPTDVATPRTTGSTSATSKVEPAQAGSDQVGAIQATPVGGSGTSGDLLMRLGGRIQAVRTRREMSQEKLAVLTGTQLRVVQEVERGALNVSVEMAARFAGALEVTLSELFVAVDLPLPSNANSLGAVLAGRPLEAQRRILQALAVLIPVSA